MLKGMNAALVAAGAGATLEALGAGSAAVPTSSARAAPGFGPQRVRQIENTWVVMSDGVKLASRLWLPEGADLHPVPAIFNYCPYFARLFTRPDDAARFPYYASHGYACVRVDIRGSGDSEGLPMDEYVKQEQDDGVEIIRWIASQRWCSGSVGMEGISWSGFNSLQVAARRPPALKAIVTHCSTDDRYADDAHYKGGCILEDMFDWGTAFLAIQGQPSDPDITGRDRWRESWLERLNAVQFNIDHWFDHPHRDDFWNHGSVIEDYGRIECPVYAVGGWVDAYKNSIFRLLEGLKVPRKGLVGPWTHIYPHQGAPGPAIGYLDEALRWWDHWLKGSDTGIMNEPMLRVWMQYESAMPGKARVPGYWAAEDAWPSTRIEERTHFLNGASALGASATAAEAVALNPSQTVGVNGGKWCPSGAGGVEDLDLELPFDQRIDDARSLTFDSPPLGDAFEMLGAPTLTLELTVDKPIAFLAARLNEVRPTGESSRITYGVLNLCHRESDTAPSALVPGERYTIKLALDHIAHRFKAGNRLRIALSTAYWPLILPAPEPVQLTVFAGSSSLSLPVRPLRAADEKLRPFGSPFVPSVPVRAVTSKPGIHRVEWDAVTRRQVIRHEVGDGTVLLTDVNTEILGKSAARSEIAEDDTSGSIETRYSFGWHRDPWRPRVVAASKITTSTSEFSLWGEMTAYDGDEKVFTRTWERKIPRRFV
jgi:putative CocE/NonD family hydrolase